MSWAASGSRRRMSGQEALELANELGVASELELGVNPPLERYKPQLFEPPALALGEVLEGDFRERRASPCRQRVGETATARLASPASSAASPSPTFAANT
jgi:hypothetical protein